MNIIIQNTGTPNGLTYSVENTRKEYVEISELVDADFTETITANLNIAASAEDTTNIAVISPIITAIRIRVRRQMADMDTTLAGILAAN